MKKTLLFAALAAAALAVSCQPKDVIIDTPENNDPSEIEAPVTRTFVCEFAAPDSKINVADDGKTTWKAGDEIMIHGGTDGEERYKVTLTNDDISADGKKATITFTINPYNRADAGVVSEYYAQYPASLVPNCLMYYEARFSDSKDFIMAACNVGETFVFYNLNGIISYKVSGDFDKVVFSGNSDETVGYNGIYQARVRDDGSGAKLTNPKFGNGSGDANPLTKVESVPVADGTTTNYIFLPAGTNFTSGFTFKFYKDDVLKKIATTSSSVNVKTGKILILGDISGKLTDYVAPSVSTHPVAAEYAEATDLSSKAANCYIIKTAGYYKLPVIKGNNTEKSAGNVFDVELVWETYNNETEVVKNSIIAGVDFDGPSNFVYFKTPTTLKPGNALIAAKNNDGDIIWSWHIWIPSTNIADVDASSIAGLTLMDRNLGALVAASTDATAIESYGMFYQWGRKDPFPGAKAFGGSGTAALAGTAITLGGQMSIAQSIKNPTVYGIKGSGDWLDSTDDGRWSYSKKTEYDPCPAGYRLPYGAKSSSSAYPLWNTSSIATAASSFGWETSAANHYIAIGGTGCDKLVFPIAGYIDDGSSSYKVNHYADRAAIWFMPTNTSSKYHLNLRTDENSYIAGSTSAARGCNVRCCAE